VHRFAQISQERSLTQERSLRLRSGSSFRLRSGSSFRLRSGSSFRLRSGSSFRLPCRSFRQDVSVFRAVCSSFRLPCRNFRQQVSVFRAACNSFLQEVSVLRAACSSFRQDVMRNRLVLQHLPLNRISFQGTVLLCLNNKYSFNWQKMFLGT